MRHKPRRDPGSRGGSTRDWVTSAVSPQSECVPGWILRSLTCDGIVSCVCEDAQAVIEHVATCGLRLPIELEELTY